MKLWEAAVIFVVLVGYGMVIEHSVVEKYFFHAIYSAGHP